MLELNSISKSFGQIPALQNISLTVLPNQIHGLLGENGAGKSTLMNILFGLLQPDTGAISLNNSPVKISSPRTAQILGIGMVHQHFKLVPTLTTLENLALTAHTSTKKILARAQSQMDQLHWPIPLHTPIQNLSVGQQQRIEIIKALLAITPTQSSVLSTQSSILILDEPTAVLTPSETTELFTALLTLKATGTAVIFISHKLNEVQKICDTLTILRRGKHILTAPTNTLTPKQMSEQMVGAPIELPHLPRTPTQSSVLSPQHSPPPPLLELRNLSSGLLKSANLQLLPHQILGIAGVDGNGQSDLAAAIVGSAPITAGSLRLHNQIANHLSIRQRSQHLAYIPEDRHLQALILQMNITQNLLLKDYRHPPYSSHGWLNFHHWKSHAATLIKQFDIRSNSPADFASQLSGGNQQKIVLARELHNQNKKIILALNPTRGLDIGATAFVMNQLLAARAAGAAVLLIHSDLDELLAISDSVHVLYNGTLTPAPSPTKTSIAPLILGLAKTNAKQNP